MITSQSIQDFHKVDRILYRDIDFMYLLPHASLYRWISHYCITFPRPNMMSEQYTIMPHGATTLVFLVDNDTISSNLFGPITAPACVGHKINSYSIIFIIEFQPAGYYAFNMVQQKELTDCVQPFDEIDPTLHRLIAQHLETAEDIDRLIDETDRLLMTYMKTSVYQQEFLLANRKIIQSSGSIAVRDLSQELFYSERQLNRLFDKYLGVSMKSYSRLIRVNKALHLLERSSLSLQQICMEAGFYDMSHLIHDIKLICGVTPQEYRNNMSDFYSRITSF